MNDPPGTPEHVWQEWPGWTDLPVLPDPSGEVVVVSAHPDDEVLAIGGLLHSLSGQGTSVRFVVVTDGEGSHPGSPTWSPSALADRRRMEIVDALATLGLGSAEVVHLGLPDSGLAGCAAELVSSVKPLVADADVVLHPWEHDGHPDHDATGGAVRAAVSSTTRLWAYPLWAWHWTSPVDACIPWHRARLFRPGTAGRAAKECAIEAFTSQLHPLSEHSADAAVLPPQVLAHFRRDVEVLLDGSATPDPEVPAGTTRSPRPLDPPRART